MLRTDPVEPEWVLNSLKMGRGNKFLEVYQTAEHQPVWFPSLSFFSISGFFFFSTVMWRL